MNRNPTLEQAKRWFEQANIWLGHWLLRHWWKILLASIALLTAAVLLGGYVGRDAVQTAEQGVQKANSQTVFSNQQVKAKDAKIAELGDSIKTMAPKIEQAEQKSAVVVAKKHDVRADSTIKAIIHEITSDPDDAPERVTQLLTDYKPKAYALPDGDSIR